MKEIVIDASFGQVRAAFTDYKELTEIYIEALDNRSIVGNIYKGKVENVLPGMQAAFIDIGAERNAFLYIKDILPTLFSSDGDEENKGNNVQGAYRICDLLKPKEDILVQVIKDPISGKGARVTTHITLPGRLAVLMPTVDYIGISRRIENEKERERLKEIAFSIKAKDMGIIVRTAGRDCNKAHLETDIKFLLGLWRNIQKKSLQMPAPILLHRDVSLFYRVLRDMFTVEIDKLIINNKEFYEQAIEITNTFSPNLSRRIEYFKKNTDIFDYFHLNEKIEGLLSSKVWLKSGGYIIIEQTEALTVIDVNTGKYIGGKNLEDTVLKTNVEAAREIARQLRLRDIGGIIIIDFIDMTDELHQNTVVEVMEKALKEDRSKSCIKGLTSLGLLEITRKKVHAPKEDILLTPCPCCLGSGKILSPLFMVKQIEGDLKKLSFKKKTGDIKILVHPETKEYLLTYKEYFNKYAEEAGVDIFLVSDSALTKEKYNIIR